MTRARPSTRARTKARARLTDPHLVALLLYLSGHGSDDGDARLAADFAGALADAQTLLTSVPLTLAFDLERREEPDDPTIARQVRAAVAVKVARTPEPYCSAVGALLEAATSGGDEPRRATPDDLRMLVDDVIDAALLRGACLMYAILANRGIALPGSPA